MKETSVILKTGRSSHYPKHGDPILASKKARTSSGRAAKHGIDQVRIDDQKFQQKLDRKHFFDRIVREANKAQIGPSGWKYCVFVCAPADPHTLDHSSTRTTVQSAMSAALETRKTKSKNIGYKSDR